MDNIRNAANRKPYTKPRLLVFGSIRDLTRGSLNVTNTKDDAPGTPGGGAKRT